MKQNICDKGEHVLKYWTEQYFLKDLTPFQKRLFDWWVGEGFFCVSNYQNTEDGTKADLMLLVGKSVYQVLGHLEDISSEIGSIGEKRKMEGWQLIKSGCEGYYHVKDTECNRKKIERLIDENIRNYRLLRYNVKEEKDGQKYLKSLTLEIYRKR